MRATQSLFNRILLLATLSVAAGCGTQQAPDASVGGSCPTGAAQVSIFDGFAQIQCGCQEAPGSRSNETVGIDCTITRSSVVFFDFNSSFLDRQLIPEAGSGFSASALIEAESSMKSHAIRFDTPGRYPFRDAFDPRIHGTIVVL